MRGEVITLVSLCRVRDCAWTAVVGGRGIPEPILKTDPSQESDRGERLEDRKKKMAMDLKELKDEMQKLGQSFEKKNSEDATRNLDLYPSYLGTKVGAALGHSYDKMAVILPLTSTSQLTPRKEDELRRLIEQADRLEEQHRKLTSDFDRDSTRIEYQLLRNGEQILLELNRPTSNLVSPYPSQSVLPASGNPTVSPTKFLSQPPETRKPPTHQLPQKRDVHSFSNATTLSYGSVSSDSETPSNLSSTAPAHFRAEHSYCN
ncbi:hypothetical protein QR680_007436 [Steinernema hermaphroditum]|uniref:Uncharacterized protein n=1 Tax=Steinernema hermaphroditum TaxID=289476 RepID=A0AA39ID63_9BILA|nr:hypothetical protein QR680_007436 [Steinernema hermaphroditum]